MKEFFNTILYQPLTAALNFLYVLMGNNLGLAIIALTLIIKLILAPLSAPALKSAQKLQDMKGELDALKVKYKDDKVRFQEEQLKLYKAKGINPLGGCLPLLLQLPVFFILWSVLNAFVAQSNINAGFLWLDLSKPDPYYILPVLAGVTQFIQSKLMVPAKAKTATPAVQPKKVENESMSDSLAQAMQTQNLYLMPALWVIMLLRLPSGLALYLIVSIVFGIIQQMFIKKRTMAGVKNGS